MNAAIRWLGNTLSNVWTSTPAARFNSFEPSSLTIGQSRRLLATGAPRVWRRRDDHTATFTLTDIPNTDLALCLALQLHLSNEGVVTVAMGDAAGTVYPNCVLAPGAEPPRPVLADPQMLRYRMEFALLNLDGTPLVALY